MRWAALRSLFCGGGAALALALLLQGRPVRADIPIDVSSTDSLKSACKEIAAPMMEYYAQNQTEGIPGKLTDTWYVAGAMFMTLIQYWQASGDNQYNSVVSHDLMFQAGRNYDYFDSNYSRWLGNDDQMFWGLAAITASETGFPQVDGKPTWTTLARAVFQMQADRWDMSSCGGGLDWQIHLWQDGHTMRNSISNGGLFQLAARLGHFTKNTTYLEFAEKIWDWSVDSPLIQPQNGWFVADSTEGKNNCSDSGDMQWTYNYGTYLAGCAYMYNETRSEKWLNATTGLLARLEDYFFPKEYGSNVISEVACEKLHTCNRNMLCFKGWTTMWMAYTAILVPQTRETIVPKLQGSATAIGKMCDGSSTLVPETNLCGNRWYQDSFDGIQGLEVQMAALGGITANLMLLTGTTALTIDNNPNAQEHYTDTSDDEATPGALPGITTADRVGSWMLTAIWGLGIAAASWWLIKQ
ncbi:glycosyl hydrolase family 76-domain-containing protein [Aspergillus pseudoustus]|uniref:Mannan endo-1,6-alpha-mannosidase n=1 Tax=Aspergillus pseudoustus TaxID=1810923 RepID=A0ABR4KIJ9_9EURO